MKQLDWMNYPSHLNYLIQWKPRLYPNFRIFFDHCWCHQIYDRYIFVSTAQKELQNFVLGQEIPIKTWTIAHCSDRCCLTCMTAWFFFQKRDETALLNNISPTLFIRSERVNGQFYVYQMSAQFRDTTYYLLVLSLHFYFSSRTLKNLRCHRILAEESLQTADPDKKQVPLTACQAWWEQADAIRIKCNSAYLTSQACIAATQHMEKSVEKKKNPCMALCFIKITSINERPANPRLSFHLFSNMGMKPRNSATVIELHHGAIAITSMHRSWEVHEAVSLAFPSDMGRNRLVFFFCCTLAASQSSVQNTPTNIICWYYALRQLFWQRSGSNSTKTCPLSPEQNRAPTSSY